MNRPDSPPLVPALAAADESMATDAAYTGFASSPPRAAARDIGLTERQAEVLECILQGMPNKLICRHLQISPGTVKNHVSAILRRLRVANRTQAVVTAARLGFTSDRTLDGHARTRRTHDPM